MQRINVVSSSIKKIGYDEMTNILEIEFNSGSVYDYLNVPSEIHKELMNATSKGKYLHAYIEKVFRYQRIS